ncbi:MAG: DUF202 domain-containing protein [Deltaproteobacteria bacterium]|nr:DUF202 domain-containing protein [Deltaproteobacteria bacterium]
MTDNDPRVFFAAERTLLAWIRTGLTTIGLGFVVARFGIFLRVISPDAAPTSSGVSGTLGVVLVMIGSLACVTAAVQFGRYSRRLSDAQKPPAYSAIPAVVLALALAVVGMLLAVFLLI